MKQRKVSGKFTKIPNELLDNERISVNAKFLMSYILRLDKKSWNFSLGGLAKATKMTTAAVSKAFDELIKEGYCLKIWCSAGRGKCGWFYAFSITRFSTIENTTIENTNIENSSVENTTIENTNVEDSTVENSIVELSNVDFFYFEKNAGIYIDYNITKDYNNPILNKIKDFILAKNAKTAKKTQGKSLGERTTEFYNSLIPYVEKYGKDMIRAFYNYWSEPNRSHTKMLCETKATFDIPRRLSTWKENDEKRKFDYRRQRLPIGMIPGEESIGKFTGVKSEDIFKV